MKNLLPILLIAFLFSACSTANRSPNFYPNAHYNNVGPTKAMQDTFDCKKLADHHVARGNKYKDIAVSTAEGAIVGTAVGAVGGAIVRNAGRGAGIGAATGALYSLYNGIKASGQEDPNWQRFVEQCLDDKGYKVYGWQ